MNFLSSTKFVDITWKQHGTCFLVVERKILNHIYFIRMVILNTKYKTSMCGKLTLACVGRPIESFNTELFIFYCFFSHIL